MNAYHVCECIEGDERIVQTHAGYPDALWSMEILHFQNPDADYSVQGPGGIVAWYDEKGTMRTVPAWQRMHNEYAGVKS